MYRWFKYYITDYFIDELQLRDNHIVRKKLLTIRAFILVFFILDTIAAFYGFTSLFHDLTVAVIGTLVFQFIFFVIYVVLFSTVRLAGYSRSSKLKRTNIEVELLGEKYRGNIFQAVDKETGLLRRKLIELRNKYISNKSWSNALIRSFLLLLLGVGPAFFFGMMLHHKATKSVYATVREKYIEDQVKMMESTHVQLSGKRARELDSLVFIREQLLTQIDSLDMLPNPTISDEEDRQWAIEKLQLFKDVYAPKIKQLQKRNFEDSINLQTKVSVLNAYFSNADFFILRARIIWKNYPVSFTLSILLFLFLLVFPFVRRYALIIYEPDLIDRPLEEKYRQMIEQSHTAHILKLKEIWLQKLADPNLDEQQKQFYQAALDSCEAKDKNYLDPAFRVNPKEDERLFIEKGNLGKYLGY